MGHNGFKMQQQQQQQQRKRQLQQQQHEKISLLFSGIQLCLL